MKTLANDLQNLKIWAIIPAAGSGQRFSKTALKQYQMILGKTVLEHSVTALNQLELAGYVLAISADDHVAQTLDLAEKSKCHFCLGGNERVNSVFNALNYLTDVASLDDWVLVHDAARPCVDLSSLQNLVQTAVETDQAAILAIPVRDTLKRVQPSHQIEATVDRSTLWQAQTPQMAKLGQLKNAIEQALKAGADITDEASALQYVGEKVQVVAGKAYNLKITYPEDLALAALILSAQA